jgi:uncharacterized membrane-anchored protein YjiN (DUF445 family)
MPESPSQQRDRERRTALRRMRMVATGLLISMLCLFLISWRFEGEIPWLAYFRAFSEAAMIGACADWFALVALFRRPFGLPIPHTAIVPQNQQRIGDTLGRFLARNFLNSDEISARLEAMDVADWLVGWLRTPDNVRLLVAWSRSLVPPAVELIGTTALRDAGRRLINTGVESIAAAPMAGRVLAVIVAQGQHTAIFDWALEAAIDFLGNNRAAICAKASEQSAGWVPAWLQWKLVDIVLDGLLETFAAARAADHPWRAEFADFLAQLTTRLADDPIVYARFERVKSEVIDSKLMDDYLAWLATEAEARLKLDEDAGSGVLTNVLTHGFVAAGEWIANNANVRDALNLSARQLVISTIVPRRDEIGGYISDVVAHWDADTLVSRLELSVGKDLQFIRINGTIVGGAVGLVLFAMTRWLG